MWEVLQCAPVYFHSRDNDRKGKLEAFENGCFSCHANAVGELKRPSSNTLLSMPGRDRSDIRTFKFLEKLLYCSISSGLTDLRARPRASCEHGQQGDAENIQNNIQINIQKTFSINWYWKAPRISRAWIVTCTCPFFVS